MLTTLETWYVMQVYTVRPAAGITMDQVVRMPGKIEGEGGEIHLAQV